MVEEWERECVALNALSVNALSMSEWSTSMIENLGGVLVVCVYIEMFY